MGTFANFPELNIHWLEKKMKKEKKNPDGSIGWESSEKLG